MNNKNALIPINNSRWYKIKRFLRIGRNNEKIQQNSNSETNEKFENSILINEVENQGQLLAHGLMAGAMNVDDLNDKQLDEMLVYFRDYVKTLEEELNTINAKILELRMENER